MRFHSHSSTARSADRLPKRDSDLFTTASARTIRKICLLALATLFLASCASDSAPKKFADATPEATSRLAEAAQDPRFAAPPFYRIEGRNGATVYLMGTVHLGPQEGWRFSQEIEAALDGADEFVMEIDFSRLTNDEIGSVLAERVILPVGSKIQDVTSLETQKLMDENDAMLAALGMPRLARIRMKPWYIAISLVQNAIGQTNYTPNESADGQVVARLDGRRITGLETFEDQIVMLDTLNPSLQDAMLRDTLGRLDETLAEMETLVTAWRTSDRAALLEIATQGVDELPALADFYDVLLTKRNHQWVGPILEMLADPNRADTTTFVAVGALHLVGADGVPALIAARQYDVTAIH